MSYTTAAKVREVLKNLSATVMSDATVLTFITRADSIIDSKIASRYTLPLTSTPGIIEVISTDISAYLIMRTLYTRDNQNKNDWIEEYKIALKMLDEIQSGDIKLIINNAEVANGLTITSNVINEQPIFDLDEIENSAVSSDLLDSIADKRANEL